MLSQAMAPLRMSAPPEAEHILGSSGKPESRARKALRVAGTSAKAAVLLFDPRVIKRTFDEDRLAFKEAKSIKDKDIVGQPTAIKAKVDLKLGAALAVSEFIGPYVGALSVGFLVQELTKNAYLGIAGAITGDYVPAVLSFEAAWLALNTSYYSNSAKSFWGKVKQFYKDLVPFHVACAVSAIPAYLFSATIGSGLITLANLIQPHLATKIHVMPMITEMLSVGVAQAIYLTMLATKAKKSAEQIAVRYTVYLDEKFGKESASPMP
jgi:hypothetical protein